MELSNLKPFAVVATFSLFSAFAEVACRPAEAAPQPGSEASLDANFTGQSWHATTRAPVPSGSRLAWIAIEENVRIDSAGRLVHAETQVRDETDAATSRNAVRITFDVPSRSVTVDRDGKHTAWTVPGSEPWILAPVAGPHGEVVPTPLVAWSTFRATHDNEWVRIVMPLEQKSYVVPRDQYVVGSTVVVGDQAVEVDDQFVRSIKIGGVELARGGDSKGLGAFRFHGG